MQIRSCEEDCASENSQSNRCWRVTKTRVLCFFRTTRRYCGSLCRSSWSQTACSPSDWSTPTRPQLWCTRSLANCGTCGRRTRRGETSYWLSRPTRTKNDLTIKWKIYKQKLIFLLRLFYCPSTPFLPTRNDQTPMIKMIFHPSLNYWYSTILCIIRF